MSSWTSSQKYGVTRKKIPRYYSKLSNKIYVASFYFLLLVLLQRQYRILHGKFSCTAFVHKLLSYGKSNEGDF